ncbi:hypothetical protein ABZ864_47675 [Streptomyces sp. NPDC047082]|uniref:hypothetical protein n=1 Tax=Streptomyces sp. NPDC047082 TaxID=3155259 RepID=UPI003403C390
MQTQTTINELPTMQTLFSAVDHITVPETHPDTGNTQEVTLPPPIIRRTERRDGTPVWILTPPGYPERIFVADQAPVTVYFKDVDPGRFTGHLPPQPQPQPQQAPSTWQQPTTAPAAAPAPPAAPHQRPAAPWTQQPQR